MLFEVSKNFTSKIAFSNHLSRTEKLVGEDLVIARLNAFHPSVDIENLVQLYLNETESCNSVLQKFGVNLSPLLVCRGIKRTHSEEKRTAGYRTRYEAGCLEKLGVSNPSKLDSVKEKKKARCMEKFGIVCNLQHPDIRRKAQETWKQNSKNNILSIKKAMIEKYGVENAAQIPEVRAKMTESRRARFSMMTIEERRLATSAAREKLTSMPNWSSKIEERVYSLAKQIFGDKVHRHQFLFGFNYDLKIGKTLIEVNGDFWHANPAKGYVRSDELLSGWKVGEVWDKDAVKRLKAEKAGYRVVTLWESDITEMTDNDIMDLLKQEVIL